MNVLEDPIRPMKPALARPSASGGTGRVGSSPGIDPISAYGFSPLHLGYSLGIACLVYFIELTNSYLPIDGENSDNFFQTLSLGRWFHAYLRATVLPEPFIPYFTTLVGLGAIAISATLAAKFLRLNPASSFAFCTFFVSFPNLAYQFEFINQSDTVSIGYALAIVSALLLWRALETRSLLQASTLLLCAAVALCLAIGAYQSLVTVPVILLAGRWVIEDQRGTSPALTRVVLAGCAYLLVAIAAYVIVGHALQSRFGVPAAQNYYAGYLNPHSDLRSRVNISLRIWRTITQGTAYYGFRTYLLASLAALALVLRWIRDWHPWRITSIGAILLLPFAFAFLVGAPLPARVYISANLSFALLLTFCLQRSPERILQIITAVIAIIQVGFVSALFDSDLRVREADVLIANRVEAMIEAKFGDRIGPTTHVYFHGGLSGTAAKKLPSSDVFGSSFFAWDGGNTLRILGLFKYYGIAEYHPVTRSEFRLVKPSLDALPKWPDPGAVQLIDGIIVVKLGDAFGWLPFPVD